LPADRAGPGKRAAELAVVIVARGDFAIEHTLLHAPAGERAAGIARDIVWRAEAGVVDADAVIVHIVEAGDHMLVRRDREIVRPRRLFARGTIRARKCGRVDVFARAADGQALLPVGADRAFQIDAGGLV